MVTIKKETKEIIDSLREMTGEPEDEILNNAIDGFIKKRITPVIAILTILGFGMFHQAFIVFSQ